MMKRIILYLMCFVLILTIASCKKKTEKVINDTIAAAADASSVDKPATDTEDSNTLAEDDVQSNAEATADEVTDDVYDVLPEDVVPECEDINSVQSTDENEQSNETVVDRSSGYDGEIRTSITQYTDEDFIITNYDFEGLPVITSIFSERSEDWSPPDISLIGLHNHMELTNGIVIRGVKKDNSTQYDSKDRNQWYSETPIEILEVYYGDANVGDSILIYEKAAVWENYKNEKYVAIADGYEPVKKGTEYLLFLSATDILSRNGRTVFYPYEASIGIYNRGRYEITDEIKNASSAEEAGLTGFEKEVFDTYYYK